MTTVCLSSTCLGCLELGGHVWVYLNWARGLVRSGCKVVLLDVVLSGIEPHELLEKIQLLKKVLKAARVPAQLCLALSPPEKRQFEPVASELQQETISLTKAAEISDILINSLYALPAEFVHPFRRAALLDIDPGLLQIWLHEGQLDVAPHDIYFTIGETVGQPGSLFPDCGFQWIHTPPPVDLESWPVVRAEIGAPYTTITNWWGDWVQQGDEMFNNQKRSSFLEFLDLPKHVGAPLELAIQNGPGMDIDRLAFETVGWRIRNSEEVSNSPDAYRNYIQNSRGEFSCAKPSCMKFQNAWISDRTLCYLASGKPAVVQHTGESHFLPNSQGLFRFRTQDEARRAINKIEADYDTHSRYARALAEEYFDAERVVAHVLERGL